MASSQTQAPVQEIIQYRFDGQSLEKKTDQLAVEEPLQISIEFPAPDSPATRQVTLAITMRSPGNDEELAAGLLFSEGLIQDKANIINISRDVDSPQPGNTLLVRLAVPLDEKLDRLQRHFFTNSGCGVCGKTSLQALELLHQPQLTADQPRIDATLLCKLPERMRQIQSQFSQTGGTHSVAAFTHSGELLCAREDVGRHNAMDKLLGACLLQGLLPRLRDALVLVSGRGSFELVQKALMADVPVLASVGAPSSLAVQLAQRHHMTLAGFVKPGSFNIYSAAGRIRSS